MILTFEEERRVLLRRAQEEQWPTGELLRELRAARCRHDGHQFDPLQESAYGVADDYRICGRCGTKAYD